LIPERQARRRKGTTLDRELSTLAIAIVVVVVVVAVAAQVDPTI